ncbi:TPA: YlbF family regulator [Streptococcus suis]|nr:YlbF family regulator [Streptococcus suis]
MELWKDALYEVLRTFKSSDLMANYTLTLEAVKNDLKSKQLLDDYRRMGIDIRRREQFNKFVSEEEYRIYNEAAENLSQDNILTKFLEYDNQMVDFIEHLDKAIRNCIKEEFTTVYGDNQE